MPVPVPGVVLDQRQQHLKPQHHLKKQISLVSDLENCVSVNCNCRCRKVALVAILLIAAGTALFCNISLVVKLGKSPQSYPDQYEFDDVPVPVDQQGQMNMNMPPEQEQEQRNDLALWNGMNENDNDDDPLSDDDSNEEQEQKQKQPPEIRAVKTPPISALQKPLKKKKKTKRKRKQKIKVGPPPSPVSVRPVKPLPESLAANATVSACLLIKDDNEILSEWIAYHYHTINLRHLIVAVDPLSSESPTAILENWRLTTDLEIREWSDVHYMPTEFIKNGKAPPEYMATESDFKNATMSADSLLEISNHRYRQRVFLASCMKAVRASGNSWVMHIVRTDILTIAEPVFMLLYIHSLVHTASTYLCKNRTLTNISFRANCYDN